ncbi:MAG: helix-turn-helix domain-containing protein [Faecalicatena sp.]|uniref:CdaR family transcriptional regulator n=1 Tax=Faecalicatena sp. TaxID=2005360 RepID=UPI00258D0F04|nr:sugar diacid recognition domain-containing protein [Faecalicatena sp.]MCI6464043.1 helix-turn-helix domain-containing protein [Faecalicatena sp.]MDY5619231.1 sugar diacid recognition domain-containing protein [Lachnospiraceae bacterium]
MELSKQLAAQIVNAVYEVVRNDINLINASGIIIGSTNPRRIGTFHEAGCQAVKSGTPVLVDEEHIFQGAQSGINYPIFLEGRPIAAIGITGNPKKLEQFGFLVTKITEVFLKEQQLNEELLSENRSLHYLVTSLIYDNVQNPKQLETLLAKYQVDPAKEYAALSIQMLDTTLEPSLRFYFSSLGCRLSLYLYPNEWIVILDRELYSHFSPKEFIEKYQGRLSSGMGPFGPLYQLNQSYHSAQIARKHARQLNTVFCNIEDISIEFVLESLPVHIQKLYSEHVLNPLNNKEVQILKTYFINNLSLKETSEALFIHKNTLQYQLDRIAGKTGLNPRIFQDAFLLQFALLCRN